jgi:hypothetical protein
MVARARTRWSSTRFLLFLLVLALERFAGRLGSQAERAWCCGRASYVWRLGKQPLEPVAQDGCWVAAYRKRPTCHDEIGDALDPNTSCDERSRPR